MGEAPPPGCRPIWIQMKNYDLYQLREEGAEAGNMTALKQYTLLDRARLLEEVGKFGFMCDWNDFKADLEACPTEEILLVGDPNKVYGEQWYFTFTAQAFETHLKLQTAGAEEEKARLEAEAEEARLAEIEANRKPVYEDKPIIARGWESETADETAREVESLTIRPERPLVVMSMTRPRRSFGLPCKLVDRDAYDWLTDDYMAKMGIRKYLATGFTAFDPANPDRKLMDSPCQAAAESVPAFSQTTWFRSVHASVQYSTMHLEHQEAASMMSSEAMVSFLRKVAPGVEQSLQQNETVDIFQDAFNEIGDDDAPIVKTNDNENELKELRTFTDLIHSKNKVMSAIDWLPKRNGCVGVSAVKNVNFDERVQLSGQVDNAYVLLWDFADLIHPMLKLESPHEIFCFRFNPSIPGVVVGGAINGQVIMWDITKALTSIDQKKRKQSVRHIGKPGLGFGGDDDEVSAAALPPVKPCAVSHIDMSHRRLVADLVWLPTTTQVNSKGQLLGSEFITDNTHQFITVASDGQCLIWDTRYQEISEGLFPHIAKPRQNYDKKREENGRPPPAPWAPLFRLQLNRLEDVGELGLCRIVLDLGVAGDGVTTDDPADGGEEVDMRSQLICTTEEGEILLADWRARVGAGSGRAGPGGGGGGGGGGDDEAVGGGGGGNDAGDGGDVAPEFVKWVSSDHTRPCVALDKSPFFPGVLLSVGDWSFQIWKVGLRKPVFTSPMAANYLTTGRWSPTRPGMLFLGKVDGSMDVWDFTDSSFTPSVTLMSSPSRITSMEFLKPKGVGGAAKLKQQLLTVGDAAGNLHVYDVPQNLWRPLANERAIMSHFLEREIKRVEHVTARLETRTAEAEAMEAEELQNALNQPPDGAAAAAAAAGGGGGEDPAGAGAGVGSSDESGDKSKVADSSAVEELTEEEKAHLAELEEKFIEELGLTDADLPDRYLVTKKLAEGGEPALMA